MTERNPEAESEREDQQTRGQEDEGSSESEQGQKGRKQEGDRLEDEKGTGPTRIQWVVGIGSTLLVLALLGFVVYLAIEGTNRPPVIQVRVERVLEARNGYVVEVGVYNEGGITAAALNIEGTLKQDTITVEKSNATISYVPADTEREAGLFFTKDPRKYKLEVRPVGYDHP